MTNDRRSWMREEAHELIKLIQSVVEPKYHVGMWGSVLIRGFSKKDLDLIILPNNQADNKYEEIRALLRAAGLRHVVPVEKVHEEWKRMGTGDFKHIEVWFYRGKRVDIFFPYPEK